MKKESGSGKAGKASAAPNAEALDPAALDPAAIEAIVAGQHGDPFAVLGIQGEGARLVARAFIDGAEEVEAFTLDDKPAGSLARRHDAGFFEGRLTHPQAPAAQVPRPQRRRRVVGRRPLLLRSGPRPDGRLLHPRGQPPPPLRQDGRPPPPPRGRRRRALRRLGAERPAGLGRRRLQRLGRPPPHHAPAPRHRHLGDLHPLGRARPRLQVRAHRPRRQPPAAQGRPLRPRLRAPPGHRLDRRARARPRLGRRRPPRALERRRRPPRRRSRSTRSTPARGSAPPTAASSPGTRWPTG